MKVSIFFKPKLAKAEKNIGLKRFSIKLTKLWLSLAMFFGLSMSINAQCPTSVTHVGTVQTVTDFGAGTGGTPSFSYTAGSGANRAVIFVLNFERDHTLSTNCNNRGNNYASAGNSSNNPNITATWGGQPLIRIGFSTALNGESSNFNDAEISIEQFVFVAYESTIALANGGALVLGGDFQQPGNAGDEAIFSATTFANVRLAEGVTGDTNQNPGSNLSITAAMLSPSQPAGTSAANNMLLTTPNFSKQGGTISSTNSTIIQDASVSNTGGTYIANHCNNAPTYTEQDGHHVAMMTTTGTGNQTVTASISTPQPILSLMRATRLVGMACADLQITKNGTPIVNPNGSVTYTIVVTNNGTSAANGATISDPSVANFTASTLTCGGATGGAACPSSPTVSSLQAGTLAIPTLPSGGSVTLTLTGTAGTSGTIRNTATVTPPSGTTDPTPGNNSSTATTTINSNPRIALVKTGVLSTNGNTITYTFTVTNTGDVPLTGVTVNDPKLTPASVTLLQTSLAVGQSTTGTGTYTVTTGDRAAGIVTNTATASGNPPAGSPVTDISGSTQANDTPTVVPVTSNPRIALVKTGVLSTNGNTITYTFTVTNTGDVPLTGVTVNDPKLTPSSVTLLQTSLAVGQSTTGTGTYTVTTGDRAAGIVTNTATASGNPPAGSPVTDISGSTQANDTPTVVPVTSNPRIALVKTGVLSTNGNTITYTFTVTNTGDVPLTGVTVNDPKLTPANVTLAATTLAPGAETTGTATYTVTAVEKTAGQVQNTATATGTPPTGPAVTDVSGTDFTNNTPTVVPVPGADLAVNKTASNLTPAIGSQITFTIAANNNGPAAATGVVVTDALPAGYTLVSATPSTGTWTAPNWNIGNLANGANATLTVVAIVNATGSYANTATITGNQPDPNSGNNTDTETPVPAVMACEGLGDFTVAGSAVSTPDYIRITPSSQNQYGQAWSKGYYDLREQFTHKFSIYLGTNTNGADGMAYVLKPLGVAATGQTGDGLGYGGMSPSLAIEFDTYQNTNVGDPAEDHISLHRNGDQGSGGLLPGTSNVVLPNINDGAWHDVQVEWNPITKNFRVLFDGVQRFSITRDIIALDLGGAFMIKAGMTGSTGLYHNEHRFCPGQLIAKSVDSGCPFNDEYNLTGHAVIDTDETILLTANTAHQSGQAWSINKADLREDFSQTFRAYFGTRDGDGADGIAFIMKGNGTGIVGTAGEGMGYGGLVPSIAIEFDTWQNPNATGQLYSGQLINDPANDHTAVHVGGNYTQSGRIGNNVSLGNIEDGLWHTIQISWNAAAKTLDTYFDGVLVNSVTRDFIVTDLNGDPMVQFGFTAGTGNAYNKHSVCIQELTYTAGNESSDLSIVKTVDNLTPQVGQNVTFTITASNAGPSAATGVVVNDQIPAGYTLVSATPSTGTWTAPNWTIGNLANGANATLTVVATVNATGPYANTATITGTEPDPNPGNNTDTETPTPTPAPAPAIALVKTGVLSSDGNTITYSFMVTNTGNVPLTNVTVNDPKLTPSSVTLASTTLAVGASTTGTGTYTVTTGDRNTGSVTNTATASGNPPTGSPVTDISGSTQTNDTPTVVPVTSNPSIALIKTGVLSANGNTVTYTFTVRNTGNVTLNPVVVNDPKLTPNNVTLAATTLAPGAETTGTATYTVTAAEKTAGQVQNTATATGTPPTGNPVTDVSGTTFEDNNPTVVPVPGADLSVTKTASNLTPQIGSQVTFTIAATNNGPAAATGVVVNDQIPAGYTLVSATPSTGTWTAPNWTIGNLASGANATLTVVATVNATGPYANTATITGTEPDPNPSNNTDTETPTPTPAPAPAIALVKTGVLSANGNTVTYTFTVKNTGNVTLNTVVVNDPKLTPSNVTLLATTLAPGAETTGTATYTVTAAEKTAGQVQNTATATGTPPSGNPVTDVSGTDFTNNTPTVVPVPGADLELTKVVSEEYPSVGGQVTFTVTAKNNGPSNATGVVVTDALPSGYVLLNATPSTGVWSAPNWTIGNLANGTSASMTIVATVAGTGNHENVASVTGNQPDPTPGNNTDSATTYPGSGTDLEVTKTPNNFNPAVGNQITFTITAKNNGPRTATGVTVSDALQSGYTFVSSTPSQGVWSAPVWSVGTLASGASATMTVVATVNPVGNYRNTAIIDGVEPDPNPNNDSTTVTPNPASLTDLEVTKVVNNQTPNIGEQVTFTVTAKNNGPLNATGITVTDALPSGYTYVSHTVSAGSWSSPVWSVGNLANGASATLNIVATVNATGNYTNTAVIQGQQPDGNPDNNTDTEVTSPGQGTDLEVTKTADVTAPNVGDFVTFTITAKNNGPRNATGVVVTDQIPSGFVVINATPSVGSWTAPNWTIGNLSNGASATLTVVATVNASGNFTNVASIDGNETDPNPDNNEDEVTTPAPENQADLQVTKVADNMTPAIGSQVTFTITAKNNGPKNATGVVVQDMIPAGYVVMSATPSVGNWSAPNWSIGNLANGASQTLTIVAVVNATGSYANTATITGNQVDPNPNNNTSTVTPTPPANIPGIALVKTGVLSTNGNTITYSFTVTNTGNTILTNVVVNDPKLTPTSVTLLATTLAPGGSTTGTGTYTVTAADRTAGSVSNTATATGNPPTGAPVTDVSGTTQTNDTPTVVVIPSAPGIALVKTGVLSTDGNTITYSFTVTNTGNVPLTGVTVNDPKLTPSSVTLASTTLAVGQSTTGTGTYTVTSGDRTTGSVTNTATATGNPPTGSPVTDVSGTTQTNDTPTVVPVDNDSSIALVKTGVLSSDGNSITYTFTVTNTGDVTLTNVKVIDPKLTPSNVPLGSTTLAPGASTTGTATYTLTEADKLGGKVTNTAITTGTTPSGCEVVDISGTEQNNDTPTEVELPCKPDLNPAITVLPNNGIAGQRDMVVLLDIKEILGCATKAGEEIRVSVAKVSDFSFNWSTYATATTIPTASVTGLENGRWTFTETSTAWVWVYNGGVINANEISNIGFMGIWNAEASSGKLDFTVTIRNGSGGESNTLNNVDYETVTYDVAP